MRILLTGVGGPAGASLARQLRSRGHWTAGVDARRLDAPEVDAFDVVPLASSPDGLPVLRAVALAHRVDAVIPSVSEELPGIARAVARGVFPMPVLVGAPEAVAIADDKLATARALDAASVAVPAFASTSAFASAAEAVHALGGPIVVKPRVSRGARDVRVVEARDAATRETRAWWATLDDAALVQRFAPGAEFAPVVFAGDEAEPGLCVVLEKTALTHGRVGNAVGVVRRATGSGPGADADAGRIRAVAALARSAVVALGLRGPADVDIRVGEDGAPVVLEVNARFGANSAHAPELLDRALERLRAEAR